MGVDKEVVLTPLTRFLDMRNDHFKERLAKRGIKTIDFGAGAKFKLLDLSDQVQTD